MFFSFFLILIELILYKSGINNLFLSLSTSSRGRTFTRREWYRTAEEVVVLEEEKAVVAVDEENK